MNILQCWWCKTKIDWYLFHAALSYNCHLQHSLASHKFDAVTLNLCPVCSPLTSARFSYNPTGADVYNVFFIKSEMRTMMVLTCREFPKQGDRLTDKSVVNFLSRVTV